MNDDPWKSCLPLMHDEEGYFDPSWHFDEKARKEFDEHTEIAVRWMKRMIDKAMEE